MNAPRHPIPIVSNNQEKGVSYTANFQRYNKAKKSEFYLECLWILYAMLEDRTSSLLFYIGFTSCKKRNSVTGSKKIKTQIRDILEMNKPNEKYRFDTISGKLERIQQVLIWSSSENNEDTPYKAAVKAALTMMVGSEELSKALSYLNDEWRDKRNQLTHSLFNKKPDAVASELEALVENGYKAVRVFDAAVREIKKYDIRGKYKIQ